MKNFIKICFLLLIILLSDFPSYANPVYSTMEIREMQTRYFDTINEKQVIKAVINTLQDNGFIVQNIEEKMGYITARKDFRANRTDKGRIVRISSEYIFYGGLAICSFGACAPYLIIPTMHLKNELSLHPVVVDANVTIEVVGKQTKVRFSFIEKIMENADGYMFIKSSPRKVVRHYEPEIYQEFFNQLDKNLFIEKI